VRDRQRNKKRRRMIDRREERLIRGNFRSIFLGIWRCFIDFVRGVFKGDEREGRGWIRERRVTGFKIVI
jgi:hypothetical protein